MAMEIENIDLFEQIKDLTEEDVLNVSTADIYSDF
jgi:hypothetical protein